jgi:hypothetical protein
MSSKTKPYSINPYIGTMAGSNGTYSGNASYTISNPNVGMGAISSTSIADAKITIGNSTASKMQIDIPLVVQGRDVMREIDEMRDALLLLKRDVDMEAKYPKLRELKDAYERQLEKYKTFDTLKESK